MIYTILFSGAAGAGKDTMANYMEYKLSGEGHECYIIHFADRLKEMAKKLGWNGEKDEQGRSLLQKIGTAIRQFDTDFWVKNIAAEIIILSQKHSINNKNLFILVPDARYINELHINKILPSQVEVLRVLNSREGYKLTEEQQNHLSENEWRHFTNYDYNYAPKKKYSSIPESLMAMQDELKIFMQEKGWIRGY